MYVYETFAGANSSLRNICKFGWILIMIQAKMLHVAVSDFN